MKFSISEENHTVRFLLIFYPFQCSWQILPYSLVWRRTMEISSFFFFNLFFFVSLPLPPPPRNLGCQYEFGLFSFTFSISEKSMKIWSLHVKAIKGKANYNINPYLRKQRASNVWNYIKDVWSLPRHFAVLWNGYTSLYQINQDLKVFLFKPTNHN